MCELCLNELYPGQEPIPWRSGEPTVGKTVTALLLLAFPTEPVHPGVQRPR